MTFTRSPLASETYESSLSQSLSHLDLFSGIGGFALAAQWAGFKTVGFCEKEPYAQKILIEKFGAVLANTDGDKPEQPQRGEQKQRRWVGNSSPILHPDIFTLNGAEYRGVTLITGGFPCQPFSLAGQRRGAADDRHIWPEMRRVIDEARPAWVLGENVPGIIGMELDRVLSDLENIGYACWPVVVPACAVDARHRRDRVWIVAYSERAQRRNDNDSGGCLREGRDGEGQEASRTGKRSQILADAESRRARSEEQFGQCCESELHGEASVAHSDETGRGKQCRAESIQAQHSTPKCSGEVVSNTESIREREPTDQADALSIGGNTWEKSGGGNRRKFEPAIRRVSDEFSKGLDKNLTYAKATITGRSEELPAMRQGTETETIPKHAGGQNCVQTPEILRHDLHGESVCAGESNASGVPQKSRETERGELREVRHEYQAPHSPQGCRSNKQCSIKPDDLVRLLSSKMALGTWEEAVERTCGLQNLWGACTEIGHVPTPSSTLQEVWGRLTNEEMEWVAVRIVSGNPFHAEWPHTPRISKGIKNRSKRLKALGNAIVPQVAYQFLKAIVLSTNHHHQNRT